MRSDEVEFFTPEILTDPYAFYEWSRAEAPVARTQLPGKNLEVFLVTTYDLVKEVLSKPDLYSSACEHILMGGAHPNAEVDALLEGGVRTGPLLLNLDEPAH